MFAVIGTNIGIFSSLSYQTAIGAGWLLLSMTDVRYGHTLQAVRAKVYSWQILWLLFITADDETRLATVFSSYAGGAPGRARSMRQSRRTSSALGIGNSAADLHSHSSHHQNHVGAPTSMNGSAGGYGVGGGSAYGGSQTALNVGNNGAGNMNGQASKANGISQAGSMNNQGGFGTPTSQTGAGSAAGNRVSQQPQMQQQQQQQSTSSHMPQSQQSGALQTANNGDSPKVVKAKALYSCEYWYSCSQRGGY